MSTTTRIGEALDAHLTKATGIGECGCDDGPRLGVFAREFYARLEQARVARSLPDSVTGAVAITNLGMHPMGACAPVINPLQKGILGAANRVDDCDSREDFSGQRNAHV